MILNSQEEINLKIIKGLEKAYEKLIEFKKQKQTEREFFVTARPENKPTTDLSPRAVKRSEDFVHKKAGPIDSFYMNSGR